MTLALPGLAMLLCDWGFWEVTSLLGSMFGDVVCANQTHYVPQLIRHLAVAGCTDHHAAPVHDLPPHSSRPQVRCRPSVLSSRFQICVRCTEDIFSVSSSIRLGNKLGANDPAGARLTSFTSLQLYTAFGRCIEMLNLDWISDASVHTQRLGLRW